MYRITEVVGMSAKSFDEAVRNAVEHVAQAGGQADYFEVVEQRGAMSGGKIKEFQVVVKVGVKE